ncbi:hypothetical protein FE257_006929 [Aspergillus nanangensis]|uniref:CSD domain-containing protein n=1 Tax=Aspergillus nanangensis TaxID=2582783 RepID=A0AAD4CNL4_ASPNN|nr:hypothetical protein FE257_006929 [Aspergillus nanangensis]
MKFLYTISAALLSALVAAECGHVKWYRSDQGLGFITPDGGGEDLFIHQSAIADGSEKLADGDRVCFDIVERRNGLREVENVQLS